MSESDGGALAGEDQTPVSVHLVNIDDAETDAYLRRNPFPLHCPCGRPTCCVLVAKMGGHVRTLAVCDKHEGAILDALSKHGTPRGGYS